MDEWTDGRAYQVWACQSVNDDLWFIIHVSRSFHLWLELLPCPDGMNACLPACLQAMPWRALGLHSKFVLLLFERLRFTFVLSCLLMCQTILFFRKRTRLDRTYHGRQAGWFECLSTFVSSTWINKTYLAHFKLYKFCCKYLHGLLYLYWRRSIRYESHTGRLARSFRVA